MNWFTRAEAGGFLAVALVFLLVGEDSGGLAGAALFLLAAANVAIGGFLLWRAIARNPD